MNIYFMYDCHLFKKVGSAVTDKRDDMEKLAADLFVEDGCGSLLARDARHGSVSPLHGYRQLDQTYGVTTKDIKEFFDRVDAHINILARG